MIKPVKRIAISGGAGQIAYHLLFCLANGDLLGPDQPIALHILELEAALPQLQGVVMELEDCAFPLLQNVIFGSDPAKIFLGVDYVFLVGAKPRGPGMERKDLLMENGKIFVGQGRAIGECASRDVLTLVVGNPANTNCLIAMRNAGSLHPRQFYSMMQLDHNRSVNMLAKKAGANISDISHMAVWGNHSSTQVPDFFNARIRGKPAKDVIASKWLEETFVPDIQKRGAAVIAARGKSSAASAGHAALGAMRNLIFPSDNEIFSMGILSDGNPYGIQDGLVFSFPCRCLGKGKIEIVKEFDRDDGLKKKISMSEKELLEERAMIHNLLGQ